MQRFGMLHKSSRPIQRMYSFGRLQPTTSPDLALIRLAQALRAAVLISCKLCLPLISLVFAGSAMAADLDIRDAYSPLNSSRPVRSKTRWLILHTTEGGDSSAQREVRRRGLANYLVLRNGQVLRIIARQREARHAGTSMWNGTKDLDRFSIGIEVVGYHNRGLTTAQEGALRQLIEQLQSIYRLGDDAVLPHSMVAYGHPNRWHKKAHRGRKRCAMQFARPDLRARIGLTSQPNHDPDVRAGRLIEADPELAKVLFGHAKGQP
ncbi:MAG: N-acetylmuramoyl-L-alanine amidase [Myxococcota bacterium]